MDCAQGECLVSLNGRVMTELDETHRVVEGSTLRIWYSVFPRQDDPVELAPGTESVPASAEGTISTSAPNASATSTASSSATPQYVPGTFLQNLVAIALWVKYISKTWHVRKVFCSDKQRLQKHSAHRCSSLSWKPPIRPWQRVLLILAGLQCGGSQAYRFGEAQHPGPEAWLGTINPSGVSGKEPILARVPYGVWGITESHLSGVNQSPQSDSSGTKLEIAIFNVSLAPQLHFEHDHLLPEFGQE